MVFVQIWDTEPDGSVIFLVSGHAGTHAGEAEKLQVCAAVSALMVCLWAYYSGPGKAPTDGDGHVQVTVPACGLHVARFVAFSLQKIAESYEGHVLVDNTSSSILQS